jgi:hypothetical protein
MPRWLASIDDSRGGMPEVARANLAGWPLALAVATKQILLALRQTALALHVRQGIDRNCYVVDLVQLALTMGFHLISKPKRSEAAVLLGFPGASKLDMSDYFRVIFNAYLRSSPKTRYTDKATNVLE